MSEAGILVTPRLRISGLPAIPTATPIGNPFHMDGTTYNVALTLHLLGA